MASRELKLVFQPMAGTPVLYLPTRLIGAKMAAANGSLFGVDPLFGWFRSRRTNAPISKGGSIFVRSVFCDLDCNLC